MLIKRGLQDDSSDEDEPISSNVDMDTNKQVLHYFSCFYIYIFLMYFTRKDNKLDARG
jgi:hypothetical protein